MKLGNRIIGSNEKPLIIAEIGINHNGNLEVAKNLVQLAAKSGCECIKHQTHIVEEEMSEEAKDIYPPNDPRSIWEIMETCSLSLEEEAELKNYTEKLGLIYISTPFSAKAADFLNDINVPGFKIGSGECDNLPLIKHVANFKKPIILSTGMNTIESVKRSYRTILKINPDICLLECTNLYPSPPENVSLKGIIELQKNFPNTLIGFSDHSIGPWMSLASIALGAVIVERHFTDSRYSKGPDIINSMDPAELRFLIDRSQEIFIARTNDKKRTIEEESVYRFARASVVAIKDISTGDKLTRENIWVKRPGNGEIPGYDYEGCLGKIAKAKIKRNTQIKLSDIE